MVQSYNTTATLNYNRSSRYPHIAWHSTGTSGWVSSKRQFRPIDRAAEITATRANSPWRAIRLTASVERHQREAHVRQPLAVGAGRAARTPCPERYDKPRSDSPSVRQSNPQIGSDGWPRSEHQNLATTASPPCQRQSVDRRLCTGYPSPNELPPCHPDARLSSAFLPPSSRRRFSRV